MASPEITVLTWDHPRGIGRLAALDDIDRGLIKRPRIEALTPPIRWRYHALEGFESTSLDSLAEQYDAIIIDHPHIADAVSDGALVPLSSLLNGATLDACREGTVGRSFESYQYRGEIWALPVDAATQVMAARPATRSLDTWAEVREFSRTGGWCAPLPCGAARIGDGDLGPDQPGREGGDIKELDAYPTPWAFRDRPDYCDAIRSIRKPVIAAINGYAFGGGLETSLSCDIRIASTNASFAAPEITLGWIGGGGVSAFLIHSIGPSNAALMVYTGEPIDAATALSWGLVSYVVEPEELLDKTRTIAATITTRAPITAQTGKLNLRAAHSMPLENCIQYERDLQTVTFATEDAAEDIRAFKEKRQANFVGR